MLRLEKQFKIYKVLDITRLVKFQLIYNDNMNSNIFEGTFLIEGIDDIDLREHQRS